MKLKNKLRQRAFTLIEIMVAVAIFSVVIAAIYSTWTLILRSSRVGQEAAAQAQRQRIAIRTIEDALTCIQSFQASLQYYSFCVTNGDQPGLSFTARLPDNYPRNGKFGDFNSRRLAFTVEPAPGSDNFSGQPQEKDLVLRQNPVLMDMDIDELQNPLVLARNVQLFSVECWDTNTMDWDTEWDDTNSIPPMIRVSLVLGGNNSAFGGAAPTLSVTRVISMPSQMLPTDVQSPGGQNGSLLGNSGGGGGTTISVGPGGVRIGGGGNGNGKNNGQNGNRNGGNNNFNGGGGNFGGGNNGNFKRGGGGQ